MTDLELQQLRQKKWRVDGLNSVRTLEHAEQFMAEVGFCLMYPVRPPLLAPTFIGAYTGSEQNLPMEQFAFCDPRALEAKDLAVRVLRQRQAYEASLQRGGTLLLSDQVFSYFYALAGDRNPGKDLKTFRAGKSISQLTKDAFAIIQKEAPISKRRLIERLGGAPSEAALDRALHELWSGLRITRVDYSPQEGVLWNALHRWAPEAVKKGSQLSVAEALSAMISKYLDCVIAAEQGEIESFFSAISSRSKIRDAVNALLAARELSFITIGKRTLIQITPEVVPHVPLRRNRPRMHA